MQLVEMSWGGSAKSGVHDPSKSDKHQKNKRLTLQFTTAAELLLQNSNENKFMILNPHNIKNYIKGW